MQTAEEIQNRLQEVRAAITAVLTRGQSVTFNGRTYTRAHLEQLRALEGELKLELRAATSRRFRFRQVVPRV